MGLIDLQFKMTKTDWKVLRKLNLIDGGEGNGFADTTEHFDNNIICNSHSFTGIVTNSVFMYVVSYKDGCFYPVWFKMYNLINNKKVSRIYLVPNKETIKLLNSQ